MRLGALKGVLLLDFISDDGVPESVEPLLHGLDLVVIGVESLPGVYVAAWLGKASPGVDWLVLFLLLDNLLSGVLGALSGNEEQGSKSAEFFSERWSG
ncbi:unnamed protein product [Oikopleura dioica]|uniref:Uncharacterized protein n=1 Tax=Oikopleura dioica TaxID=34765 RepID=E4Y5L7_OIKDI|nr:unnamed protein product [Oikopleura dioica]